MDQAVAKIKTMWDLARVAEVPAVLPLQDKMRAAATAAPAVTMAAVAVVVELP